MKGEGAFSQCRLDHIVRDLERKFNVKIVITDHSLSSEVFTCRFAIQLPLNRFCTCRKKPGDWIIHLKGNKYGFLNH